MFVVGLQFLRNLIVILLCNIDLFLSVVICAGPSATVFKPAKQRCIWCNCICWCIARDTYKHTHTHTHTHTPPPPPHPHTTHTPHWMSCHDGTRVGPPQRTTTSNWTDMLWLHRSIRITLVMLCITRTAIYAWRLTTLYYIDRNCCQTHNALYCTPTDSYAILHQPTHNACCILHIW